MLSYRQRSREAKEPLGADTLGANGHSEERHKDDLTLMEKSHDPLWKSMNRGAGVDRLDLSLYTLFKYLNILKCIYM